MTEITFTETQQVSSMFVDVSSGSISGTVSITLTPVPPATTAATTSPTTHNRQIADTTPEVQAAIDTLVAAVLVWEQEDTGG